MSEPVDGPHGLIEQLRADNRRLRFDLAGVTAHRDRIEASHHQWFLEAMALRRKLSEVANFGAVWEVIAPFHPMAVAEEAEPGQWGYTDG